MTQMDKLITRLKTYPKDFTWSELTRILKALNFQELQGNGSRVKFFNREKNCFIPIHKPYPSKILKYYVLKEVITQLEFAKFI